MSVITSVTGDVAISIDGGTTYVNLREATKWNWSAKVNTHEYASNFTGGVRRRLRGTKQASGSINGVYDPYNPIQSQVNEDTDCIARFYFIGTSTDQTGVSDQPTLTRPGEIVGGHYIQCPTLVDKLDFNVDIDNGNIVDWSLDWGANGTWTYPAALVPLMAFASKGPIPQNALYDVGDQLGADEEELENIAKVTRMVAAMLRDNPGQARPASQLAMAV